MSILRCPENQVRSPMRIHSFLGSLLVLLVAGAWAQSVHFRHYTVNDGLPGDIVYYSVSDSKGYMWFCTESGVSRFDGKSFETFTIKDGLADNDNFRCVEDLKGRIWFSSYNGKLSYFQNGRFINEGTEASLKDRDSSHKYINGMMCDPQGTVWYSKCGKYNVLRYDGKQLTEKATPAFDKKYTEHGVRLFINYKDTASILSFSGDSLVRINLRSGASHRVYYPVTGQEQSVSRPYTQVLPDGSQYFISNAGLCVLRNDSVRILLRNGHLGNNKELSISSFRIVKGDFWVGANRGLFVARDFQKKGFQNLEYYLEDAIVSHITEDSEGGIWVNTLSGGCFYLRLSQSYLSNIPIKSVTAIQHSGYGNQYGVGTYTGHFMVMSGERLLHHYFLDVFGAPPRINRIKWLSQEQVLIGSDIGLFLYSIKSGHIMDTLMDTRAYSACSDIDEGDTKSWIISKGAISLLDKGKFIPLCSYNDLYKERFVSVTASGDTGCWFTTVRKLYRFDLPSGKCAFIAGENVFASNLVDIKQAQGYLWVATDGNGVFILKNNKLLKHLSTGNSALTGNTCHKILYEGGRIWITTNNGINVFDARTLHFMMSFMTNDNLINVNVKDLDVHDGKIYAATADGISIIDLHRFIRKTKPPEVYVKQFTVGSTLYPLSASPVFTYVNGIIRMTYTAITFQSPETLKYRYKIKDKDHGWSETSANVLEFYNLSPGSYELSLCAKKYNSDWSRPVSFKFTILPLWYQSKWFRGLIACSLLLLVVLVAWLVVRSNKRKSDLRQRILESEVKAIRLYMNPHFIFNSLSSLQVFILKHKWQEAENYIPKFAKLIRLTMSYSERQAISLREETEFLKTYVQLENTRFDKGFVLELGIEEGMDTDAIRVPPLVIQPIVENAIKYGLAGKDKDGILKIGFREKEGLIVVEIEDNGPGRRQVAQNQALSSGGVASTGIRYTEERLKLLLKKRKIARPLWIEDLEAHGIALGTKVTLLIPVVYD